jgi:four helix bundle protein
MSQPRSHRDLIVWQKAMDMCVQVYEHVSQFPQSERFRLSDQLSRAVVSVPGNIAEGHARGTRKDYAYFLAVAQGSLAEVETYLLLSVRLKFAGDRQLAETMSLLTEVSKMLSTLRKRLSSPPTHT